MPICCKEARNMEKGKCTSHDSRCNARCNTLCEKKTKNECQLAENTKSFPKGSENRFLPHSRKALQLGDMFVVCWNKINHNDSQDRMRTHQF